MRFIRSFAYAFSGVKAALRDQLNLRIHFAGLAAVSVAGFCFDITALEWCVILLASGLVIGLELINTAVENLTDLVTKEKSPLAGKVKDVAAAAVLFAAVVALLVGLIIFVPYISR